MKQLVLIALGASLLAGCSEIPAGAYYNRGSPESLLDVSSEIVNLDIASHPSVDALAEWINQDHPSRAELYCREEAPTCQAALDVMDLYGVPYQLVPSSEQTATLVYERVLARDCENRYIDNSINPYNLNHPTFGCTIAANIVQMASDKQQFVRPNLLDPADAKKAVQSYQNYQTRREVEPPEGLEDSLLQEINVE